MKKVSWMGKEVKARREGVKQLVGPEFDECELDVKVEMIQALIPIGLMYVEELLKQEVKDLAGERYKRGDGRDGIVRWGKQWGSVYLGDQKVPVEYQRLRDRVEGKEVELQAYKELGRPREVEGRVLRKVLSGLSCRRYDECSRTTAEAFGLSASSVSREFIRASGKKLEELLERDLGNYDIAAVIIDGKTFQEDEMIIALGVTMKGEKVILGFVQAATENARVVKQFLTGLVERGLDVERGVLCLIDGSKGLRKAVQDAFGGHALVQRCQIHKRRNVVSHLPKRTQATYSRLLQRAYEEPTYEGAKRKLEKIRQQLSRINESAARSLDEGFEETLTLHRLGLMNKLGKSLRTTNCIESVMASVGQRTDKVDHWRNSDQKQRWLATALLDIEPRLNHIKGHTHLPALRAALQKELGIAPSNEQQVAA
jgi:putative transposase